MSIDVTLILVLNDSTPNGLDNVHLLYVLLVLALIVICIILDGGVTLERRSGCKNSNTPLVHHISPSLNFMNIKNICYFDIVIHTFNDVIR